MPYNKTIWVEGETAVSPRNMNNIESGIEDAHAQLEAHKADNAPHAGYVMPLHIADESNPSLKVKLTLIDGKPYFKVVSV